METLRDTADYADLRESAVRAVRDTGRQVDQDTLDTILGVCTSALEKACRARDEALILARREEDNSTAHATDAHYLGEHVAFVRLRKALPGLMNRDEMSQIGYDSEYATALHDVVNLMHRLEDASEEEAASRRRAGYRVFMTAHGPATEADISRALKMAEEQGGL